MVERMTMHAFYTFKNMFEPELDCAILHVVIWEIALTSYVHQMVLECHKHNTTSLQKALRDIKNF